MSIRNLDGFFAPRSIAVIGPSRHEMDAAGVLLERLEAAGFRGKLFLVGLTAAGQDTDKHFRSTEDLPAAPDIAIYLGAPEAAPAIISNLGARGTKAFLIVSPGFETWPEDLTTKCLKAARPHQVRLVGPGSLGLAAPHFNLDVLLAPAAPLRGELALIGRSSAVLNSTLAWASSRSIGFSSVISLGEKLDVDIGDLVDYFAQDYRTRAILLHMEAITSPRKFMSATRAAARSKPVIVIRSGRSRDITGTGTTHAGRMTDQDAVYEAAFRRAGILRVDNLDEMLEAVETLTRLRIPRCERLAILANGRSFATLATDRLADMGGRLATFSETTEAELSGFCRPGQKAGNPLTLKEHLSPTDIEQALGSLLADPAVDGVLALQAPSAFSDPSAVAGAIANAARNDKKRTGRRKALVAGLAAGSPEDRRQLDAAGVPAFTSPASAVRGYMYLARDAAAREFLMAAPASLPSDFATDAAGARSIVDNALEHGRHWLNPEEVQAILTAYGVPVMETRLAPMPETAAEYSREIFKSHKHCVLKVISPDLPFKSRIDGVRLGLETPEAVRKAGEEMLARVETDYPDARLDGLTVQPMLEDRHGLELYLGLADDPVFGPTLVFGHGGTIVETNADIALELPPLDLKLAHALIDRTRISRLLSGGNGRPELDREAVALSLMKLSQIAVDIPEILELDINPLVARKDGVLVLDSRMALGVPKIHPGRSGTSRLAIAPYPVEWEQTMDLKDGSSVFVRPVRPEDEDLFKTFFEAVSPTDLRLRFFAPVKDFSHKFLARLTQLDYSRAMAFAAIDPDTGALLGVVRLHADPNHATGEYAVMVRSDLKGHGLGWALMKLIIRYAKADGIQTIKGEVLKENTSMLGMCQALGFSVRTSPDDPAIADVTLPVSALPDNDNA